LELRSAAVACEEAAFVLEDSLARVAQLEEENKHLREVRDLAETLLAGDHRTIDPDRSWSLGRVIYVEDERTRLLAALEATALSSRPETEQP
jgi:hypothetical protein